MSDRIYLDCDGVLLDYVAGYRLFMQDRFGLDLSPVGPDSFDMRAWTGLSHEDVRASVLAFNSGADTGFDRLPPMPGAVEGVRRLKENGYRIFLLSSADAGGSSLRSREMNLSAVFGDVFEEMILIGIGASKREILGRLPTADWVDDHLPNAIAGLEAGHRSHVIRQSHNILLEPAAPGGLLWSADLLEVHDRIRPDISLSL